MVVHLAFLVFLAAGGLLAWRWRAVVWVHVPAVVWALLSITVGLDCPLTQAEKHFRRLAGGEAYSGGFVDRYVEGVVYPERFTMALRGLIALTVIVGYVRLWRTQPPGQGPRGPRRITTSWSLPPGARSTTSRPS